jgi:6-phosphogluconolactonase
MNKNWYFFNSKKVLLEDLANKIINISKSSIKKKGFFKIVLTGGKSLLGLYKILSKKEVNFNKWYIFLSDERFVAKDHKDRNDYAIKKIWLNNQVPKKNIKFIKPELGLTKARQNYENIIKKVEKFDLVLLSIGRDGHISSLFPEHIYNLNQNVIIENNSPKSPKIRISMSYDRLNRTRNLFKVLIGKSKKKILKKIYDEDNLPVNLVSGQKQKIFIYC